MSSYWTETKMSITWCSSQKRKVQRCFCKLPSWSPAAYRWVRTTAVLLQLMSDWYVLLLWISGQSTQTSIQELAQKVRTKNLVHSHWIARERPSKWMDWILANSNITSKCSIKKNLKQIQQATGCCRSCSSEKVRICCCAEEKQQLLFSCTALSSWAVESKN